ncbi:unnamed protein product [Anisakis simplex]|uniref:LTD domain-containing protein n=1 Tax=Anisakis simplex TaxID=6269 RepID=A0A0M3KKQ6_ANISI|nr:unnamed protein product [Anisakis simplex]
MRPPHHKVKNQESGELTSKIYYKGTAKGNVSIKEASIDGKYILLENTSLTADENIGKWQLVRKVDDKPEVTFTFPEEFILKAGRSIKVSPNQ